MKPNAICLITVIAVSNACSADEKEPPKAASDPVVSHPPPAPPARVEPAPERAPAALAISPDIQQACGLPESKTYFAVSSSKVRRHDRDVVKELARCFTTGPLQSRQLRLVGHTDPRGSVAYNQALGQQRADSVKAAISSFGMSALQISTESRGKLDAAGTNEEGWSSDRRVEALLVP